MLGSKRSKQIHSWRHKPRRLWRNYLVAALPMKFGLWATLLVVFLFTLLMFGPVPNWLGNDPSKWSYLWSASPNELGDTLAGFAGTLAFLWIIVTVMLQSKELVEQRKEFKKMASAQSEQVKLLIKQGEIFEKEQTERAEERANRLLEERLLTVASSIESLNGWIGQIERRDQFGGSSNNRRASFSFSTPISTGFPSKQPDLLVREYRTQLGEALKILQLDEDLAIDLDLSPFRRLIGSLRNVKVIWNDISPEKRERLERLGFRQLEPLTIQLLKKLDVPL